MTCFRRRHRSDLGPAGLRGSCSEGRGSRGQVSGKSWYSWGWETTSSRGLEAGSGPSLCPRRAACVRTRAGSGATRSLASHRVPGVLVKPALRTCGSLTVTRGRRPCLHPLDEERGSRGGYGHPRSPALNNGWRGSEPRANGPLRTHTCTRTRTDTLAHVHSAHRCAKLTRTNTHTRSTHPHTSITQTCTHTQRARTRTRHPSHACAHQQAHAHIPHGVGITQTHTLTRTHSHVRR